MIDDYTRLLEAAAETADEKKADEAVTRLIAHLKSTGRLNLLGEIARELRKVAARRVALAPRVEVAHKKESAAALRAAAKAGIRAKHAIVNTSLIRGWRATAGGTLVDRSAKAALVEMFRTSIT